MPTTSTIHELEAHIAVLTAANQALERERLAQQQLIDELRDSEAKFAHAFNCSAAILSISTLKDGRYVEVNDAFCQTVGCTRAEVIGKTSQEINLWADVHDRDRIVAALRRDGTVRNWDVPMLDKHGNRHEGIFSADLIMFHGEPHLLVSVNDITERKRAEEALRQSEDKFARAFNASASLMGISTIQDGRYIEVNDEFCRVLGYTRAEVIGKTSQELNILADYDQRDVMVEKLQRGEIIRDQEVELLTKQGDRRIGLFSPDIIMIHGEPHLLATVNDITERKRAEEALRQSEDKFARAFNASASLMVISTIREGRYVEVNDEFCRVSGYTRAEVIGKTIRELNFWTDIHARELVLAELERGGMIRNREVEHRSKDGDRRISLFSADVLTIQGEPHLLATVNDITELKRAEEALRQSEDKFARAFNANTSLMGISTMQEGRYIEVNDEFCRVLGYTRAEVIGKTSQELNLWTDIHDRDRIIAVLQRDGTLRNREVELRSKDGDRHIGLFSAELISMQGTLHVLTTVNDITDRKRAERLVHIQRDLAVALNATSHLEEGTRLSLNAALDVSGMDSGGAYVLSDATGDLDLITHTGFRQPAFVEMVRHARAGTPNHALVMVGKPIYSQYLLEAQPINPTRLSEGLQALALIPLQHEGQVIGSLNVASHTSPEVPVYAREALETIAAQIGNAIARLKAETRLSQSEHAYRTLTENALIGIYKTTRAGVFLYVNPAMLRMLGHDSLSELQQHPATEFYQNIHERERLLDTLEKQGSVTDFEITLHTKHGQGKQVILSATLEGDQISGTMFDISERQQAEQEIRRLNAELETRVMQRTAELEAANRELKDFAHIVSHDLKAPLRAVSRLGQWLVEDYAAAFDDEGKEMVAMLIQRVKGMDSLIDGILEYSRVGRVVHESIPVDLNRLIPEILEQIAPPPHIRIAIETSLPTVSGDKIRLFQVFQNLFSNAIRFMDKPAGQITIGCVDEEMQWRLSVTDNGPGIDPRHHERIFQIFQTAHARDELDSTGVGLAIVKKIVEFYGGRVGVESTAGSGSTFWLTWPKNR